ncbi:MAG: tRNA lysidine(34) synthetase TilS [Pirellulaceae bacterium]
MNTLQDKLARSWPPEVWREVTVIVAVSGGADSVALLRWLAAARDRAADRLVVAHYNHRWRGAESDADETLVRALCDEEHLPCEVGRAPSDAPTSDGDGLEAAARDRRYEFLIETARNVGARYVATAHTADDQVETILHRILRGAGPSGLAGIPRLRTLCDGVTLIRPLLEVTRAEVLEYLTRLGQPYRQDASNRDPRFTRNRLRHELLPLLRAQYNPRVDDGLLRLGRLCGELQQVVAALVDELLMRAVRDVAPCEVRIETGPLADTPPYLQRELLIAIWKSHGWQQQEMSFERWEQLAAMLLASDEAPSRRDFPGGVSASREAGRLVLRRES